MTWGQIVETTPLGRRSDAWSFVIIILAGEHVDLWKFAVLFLADE